MRSLPIRDTDVLSGLVFTGIGLGVAYASISYDIGNVARMGPGFFPLILGLLLAALGIAIAARGFANPTNNLHIERLRPIIAIGLSLVAFGWILTRFGFAPALLLACLISMAAIARTSVKELLLLPVILCIFCSLVFIYGLGLTIPLVKW
jgi:hypothetical protein